MNAKSPTLTKGADGWRGIIHEGFSIAATASLAQAISTELYQRFGQGTILVAHDGRFFSAQAAEMVAEKVAETGHIAVFAGLLSTPLATFAVRRFSYLGALIITASHNPFYWNGLKLKVAPGLPPSKELELAIEKRRQQALSTSNLERGRIVQLELTSLKNAYLDEITRTIDLASIRSANPTLGIDGLGGVAGGFFYEALQYFGCTVKPQGINTDPFFNGNIPDPTCPESRTSLSQLCQELRLPVGFILDGDGDRLGVIDQHGNFIVPHDILALLLLYLHQRDKDKAFGTVITTVSAGCIVRRVAHRLGLPHQEAPIGFKHIAPFLQGGSTLIAGGSVGDIGMRGYGCDRDPIVAALFLLELMVKKQQSIYDSIADLHTEFGSSYYYEKTYSMVSFPADALKQRTFQALAEAGLNPSQNINNCDGFKFYMDRNIWLLVRKASTEKGIRVYMEAEQEQDLDSLRYCLDEVFQT
jgi:phosphomannomutase